MNSNRTKPELMSPAGYWPQLQTAIEAGADAVYFGLNHFSARAKVGFSLDELPDVMQTLHGRGVKGFVAFNTLVFDHELKLAETAIIAMANSGVDAVIVQDVGMCRLIKSIAPELEIHGSTQMSITSAQGAKLAQSLGCSRVVLGRELSLTDMRKIASATDVELEVFVHGALCVSYSGQCFSSEAWGGRSANRGKCAQACRLSYDLIVDGEERDLGEYRYLLSPGDLYAIEQVPELMDIGISCLKIEGRYKGPEYVALTTRAYREAIDLAYLNVANEIDPTERLELEQVYSRGLDSHFMSGTNHQTVVVGRAPRHRGVQIGKVTDIGRKSVFVETLHPIKRGDGVVFDAASWRSPDEDEEGGHIYEVTESKTSPNVVELEFGHREIDFSRIHIGDLVWRTHDPALNKKLRSLTRTETPTLTRALDFEVLAEGGVPIEITASLKTTSGKDELVVKYEGEHPLQPAKKRGLDEEMLSEKLGRLGGSPFHLGELKLVASDSVFIPTSELNQARRDIVETILGELQTIQPLEATESLDGELQSLTKKRDEANAAQESANGTKTVSLHLLVRTAEQLDAAIAASNEVEVASITLDYLELYGLRPSVEKIREANITPRVASPRILKPSEQNVIRFLQSLECEILVRSGGLLFDLVNETKPEKKQNLIGDFSLNAANAISAWHYLDMGLTRITPTYDLNREQISDLTQQVPCSALEVIAYSHLPVFHTEHCVFCRFLSEGTDNTNCGHPCEKHQVAVRDSNGRAHAVMADVGCRNTIFGAEAQTNPAAVSDWLSAGISNFRLEFVHQTADQVADISKAFGKFLANEISSDQLHQLLQSASPQSTTVGSLFVPGGFKKLVELQ